MEVHTLVFSPIEVNTYIIADDNGNCAIVDCGCYSQQESEILVRFLESRKLTPVLLLNTHCHLDHVFGNNFMLEKYHLRTISSELDEPNRKNASQHSMKFGLEMATPPEPESFIVHGQKIPFGEHEFEALHVPGHTAGSLAFYSASDGFVITGDALFAGSIGRTDLPGGDYDTLITSIKSHLFTLPPATVVYPGHRGKTTIGKEIATNPFFN
jgi:hydroxyacylglutathione hydrolase